jgi:chromosome segregation ATPase
VDGHARYAQESEPEDQPYQHPACQLSDAGLDQMGEPGREELKQASLLLERGIEQMFRREGELANKCASLCSQIEELQQELAQQKAALASEAENRAALERKHSEKISSLLANQERDRHEWRQQVQSRDEALIQSREEVESASRLLQAEQAAAATLREEIVSLQVQQEEMVRSLAQAREELAAEQAARLAAEEQATNLAEVHSALEQQLADHKDVEQQMHEHLASLTSLCSRMNH